MNSTMSLIAFLCVGAAIACVALIFIWLLLKYLNGPLDAAKRKKPPYDWFKSAGLRPSVVPIPSSEFRRYVIISDVRHFDETGELIYLPLFREQAIDVVFEDFDGRQAVRRYSVCDAGPLAYLLSKCNPNGLKTLQEKGVAPSKFKQERFAKKMLLGKTCYIRVDTVCSGFVRVRVDGEK